MGLWKTESIWIIVILVVIVGRVCGIPYHQNTFAPGYCAMEGRCYGEGGHDSYPCAYNRPAFRNGTLQICEQYQDAHCCSTEQLDDLMSALLQEAQLLLGACPACYKNFVDFGCAYSCSPNQSMFVNVTNVERVNGTEKYYVTNSTFYVDPDFVTRLYDSCKDVEFGATGKPVMEMIFNARNVREFLAFFGSAGPYPVEFILRKNNSLISRTRPCTDGCWCNDCPASCRAPGTPPPSSGDKKLLGLSYSVQFSLISFVILLCSAVFEFCLPVLVSAMFFAGRWVYRVCFPSQNEWETFFESVTSEKHRLVATDQTVEIFDRIRRFSFHWLGYAIPRTKKHSRYCETELLSFFGEPLPVTGFLRSLCAAYGRIMAVSAPAWIVVCLVITLILSTTGLGIVGLEIVSDPEGLWSSPRSTTARDERAFNDAFGPFWRIEQMVITSKSGGPIVTKKGLQELFDLESRVRSIVAYDGTRLEDICYKPVIEKGCMVQSVLEYFQENITYFQSLDDPVEHVRHCADENHLSDVSCRSSITAPTDPENVFGGFSETLYSKSLAMFSTMFVNNRNSNNDKALAWESAYLQLLKDHSPQYEEIHVNYLSQRSIQDEIERESKAAWPSILISYIVMVLYIWFSVGDVLSFERERVLRHSRIFVGFGGVLTVSCALLSAVGLGALLHIRVSVIFLEVVPFLVLAIGTDSMFLLCARFDLTSDSKKCGERLELTIATIGPSLLVAAVAEICAFLAGLPIGMPAIQNFVLYTVIAVFFDCVYQLLMFVGFLAMDEIRHQQRRYELIPCIRAASDLPKRQSLMSKGMNKLFVPWLLHPAVKISVIATFSVLFVVAAFFVPTVPSGLDQYAALPGDSYLHGFFDNVNVLLHTGLPMFFVVQNANFSDILTQNDLCALGGPHLLPNESCQENSLMNYLRSCALEPNEYFVTGSVASWLDDYLRWLRAPDECCALTEDGRYCDPTDPTCPRSCDIHLMPNGMRPDSAEFEKWLPIFLNSTPSEMCALSGSIYQSEVELTEDGMVKTARFRLSQRVLRTQGDFIMALRRAYEMRDSIRDNSQSSMDVFPYCIFYIYFDQYLRMGTAAALTLLGALVCIFLVIVVLFRSLRVGLLAAVVVLFNVFVEMAWMKWWSLSLNEISVVNLCMTMGLSIEFVSHIAYAYLRTEGSRDQRVVVAMTELGSAVVVGIALTKLFGIIVLGMSPSPMFRQYYFRMFLMTLVTGVWSGLVAFPVFLSVFGPSSRAQAKHAEQDQGFEESPWESESENVEDTSFARPESLLPLDEERDDERLLLVNE